jgi:D-tyrosyl-tRNA(Tyr) deacylase
MRLLIQRVLEASVSLSDTQVSSINKGLLVLLGINQKDDFKLAEKMAKKLVKLRLWPAKPDPCQIDASNSNSKHEINKAPLETTAEIKEKNSQAPSQALSLVEEESKEASNSPEGPNNDLKTWDKSVKDLGYEILVVSQFTLYGVLKGNKPDFHNSMGAEEARKIYEFFVGKVEEEIGKEKVGRGRFQEHMHVKLVNDGPVTLVWDEDKAGK